jgi:hypothetical protein
MNDKIHILSLNLKLDNNILFITHHATSKLKVSLISIQDNILQIRGKLGPCSENILAGECSVLLGLVE